MSGSFRLKDVESYSSWYGFDHDAPALLHEAVYGLPEWNAKAIAPARLVANPGCYPTSVLLALLPLVTSGMLEIGSDIFCDSKSGVTGAGRGARVEMLFGEVARISGPTTPSPTGTPPKCARNSAGTSTTSRSCRICCRSTGAFCPRCT